MYSHSKKWVSDQQKVRNKLKAVNKTRNRMFPKSCAWTADYDLDTHHAAMAKLRRDRDYAQIMDEARDEVLRRRQGLDRPAPIRLPLQAEVMRTGNMMSTNHSAVLAQPTCFVYSYWKMNRPIAPWPCKEELHHEGDYRISNEKHLRRMLPAPRDGTDETLSWAKRPYIQPYPLDDFRVFRNLPDSTEQFDDAEAEHILGPVLVKCLDPVDRL